MNGNVGSKPGGVFKFFGAASKKELSTQPAAVSVGKGLSQIGMASAAPEDTCVALKRDAQLRSSVTVMTAEAAALKGSGKSEKLVGLVDQAMATEDPTATMASSFSKYLGVSDAKAGERVGKLSQAVYDYANNHPDPEKKVVLEDALRSTLASLPLLNTLDTSLQELRSKPPRETTYFAQDNLYPLGKLAGGLVNPYLFDKDHSNGPICRDMTSLVSDTNTVLSGRPGKSELIFLREQIQGKLWTSEISTYEKYLNFEKNDLGLTQGGMGPQNAYAVLGLHPGVSDTDLAATLAERKSEGYVDRASGNSGSNNFIRNAAFQLQTPEGKAEYDLYLSSKTDPVLADKLQSNGVSRDDAHRFGTVQGELRFTILRDCITQALDALPK